MNTRLRAATPHEGKDGKTYWTDVGVAFRNEREGAKSYMSITLHALPVNGKLALFEATSGEGDDQGVVGV